MSEKIILNPAYWECGCSDFYVHEDCIVSCPRCGQEEAESPEARAEDVVEFFSGEVSSAQDERDIIREQFMESQRHLNKMRSALRRAKNVLGREGK